MDMCALCDGFLVKGAQKTLSICAGNQLTLGAGLVCLHKVCCAWRWTLSGSAAAFMCLLDEWSDQAYGECQACTAGKDHADELCADQRSTGYAKPDRSADQFVQVVPGGGPPGGFQ